MRPPPQPLVCRCSDRAGKTQFVKQVPVCQGVQVALPECAQFAQDPALVGAVEDVLQEPAERISPEQLARLERAECGGRVVDVLRTAEIRGVAGVHGVVERHVFGRPAHDLEETVHHADVRFARAFGGDERALFVVCAANRLQCLFVAVVPPRAAAGRMAVGRVVACATSRRAYLVDEDRLRAKAVQYAPGETSHDTAPLWTRRAHDRHLRRPRRILLDVARTIGAPDGIRFGHEEAARRRRPEPPVRVRHRFLSDGFAKRDAILHARLFREIFGIVHVVAGMLPQMPVQPRRPFREKGLRPGQHVRRVARTAMDVDPKRDFADAARVGRNVLYGSLCRPFLPERKIAVASRRRPPVALQRRKHDGVARPVGAQFSRRREADVLLAFYDKTLDPRLRVFGGDIESVFADEKRTDHRCVSEVVAADRLRLGCALSEKPCAMVAIRQHRVALAIARHAVETREIGREKLPVPRTVVEGKTPRLRAVGAFFNRDLRIQNAAFPAERNVAPDENLLAGTGTRTAEKRGFMRGHFYEIRQISVPGELRRPQIAAAGGEFRRADANRAQRVFAVERHVHRGTLQDRKNRGRAHENFPHLHLKPLRRSLLHAPDG